MFSAVLWVYLPRTFRFAFISFVEFRTRPFDLSKLELIPSFLTCEVIVRALLALNVTWTMLSISEIMR